MNLTDEKRMRRAQLLAIVLDQGEPTETRERSLQALEDMGMQAKSAGFDLLTSRQIESGVLIENLIDPASPVEFEGYAILSAAQWHVMYPNVQEHYLPSGKSTVKEPFNWQGVVSGTVLVAIIALCLWWAIYEGSY